MITGIQAETWLSLQPGHSIILPDGIDYEITNRIDFNEVRNLAKWVLFEIVINEERLWIVFRMVGDKFVLRVMEDAPDFEEGNREDHISWENLWLFQEPETPDYEFLELQYSQEMERGEATYIQRQGELSCKVEYTPKRDECEGHIATLLEYTATVVCNYNEILLVETGNPDNESGGLIKLFIGHTIDPKHVKIHVKTGELSGT